MFAEWNLGTNRFGFAISNKSEDAVLFLESFGASNMNSRALERRAIGNLVQASMESTFSILSILQPEFPLICHLEHQQGMIICKHI